MRFGACQVLARGPDVIPIPGTKRAACVDENLGALDVHLSAEELKELEDAVPHHEVRCTGDLQVCLRWNPALQQACSRSCAVPRAYHQGCWLQSLW